MIRLYNFFKHPALLLIVGTMIVAAPRYMEVAGFTVNFMVTNRAWEIVNFVSGLGMALIEGLTIWFTWNSWNEAPPSLGRKALMILLVLLLSTLAGSVWFAMFARSAGQSLSDTFAPFWRGIWAACTTLAPFFVMASAGIAESLKTPASAPSAQTSVPSTALVTTVSHDAFTLTDPIDQAIAEHPNLSNAQIADQFGVSRQTIYTRRRTFAQRYPAR